MKSLGIFETKNRLSELCEDVAAHGDPLVVTRHGKPLVQIVPYRTGQGGSDIWGCVAECEAKYGPLEDEFELPERKVESNRPDPLA
jgi:prevent-host-death family protein